jgi:hypothetical protein
MKNTLSLILTGMVLAAGAMFAAPLSNDVTVTVGHEITLGSTTLTGGTYTMTPMENSDGTEYFVVRSGNAAVLVPATKVEGEAAKKTAVTISEDGGAWKFNKLSIEGQTTSYEFSSK